MMDLASYVQHLKKKKNNFEWNVTEWGLFLNIIPFMINALLQSVLQYLGK